MTFRLHKNKAARKLSEENSQSLNIVSKQQSEELYCVLIDIYTVNNVKSL